MTQGAENDLVDIRFYTNTSLVDFVADSEPLQDLNTNTLTVDNKAILAKDIALQADADFTTHQGGGAVSAHGVVTTTVSGFMSAADKLKLDGIQDGAGLNIIDPADALELVSSGVTSLHRHPTVDATRKGFMSAAEKSKLDGIQNFADVNNVSPTDATALQSGDASLLHDHVQPSFVETFTEGVHFTTDHTGFPGITPYTGINSTTFVPSLLLTSSTPGVLIHSNSYAFQISILHAGFSHVRTYSSWISSKGLRIADVQVVAGNTGVVTLTSTIEGPSAGLIRLSCWQGAGGL